MLCIKPREIPPDEHPREFVDTYCNVAFRSTLLGIIGYAAGAIGGSLSALALKTCSVGTGALFGTTATAVALPIGNELSNSLDRKIYEYVCTPRAKHKRIIAIVSAIGGYFAGTGVGYGVCKAAGVRMNYFPDAMGLGALSMPLGVGSIALAWAGCFSLNQSIQLYLRNRNRPVRVPPEGDGGPIPPARRPPIVRIAVPVAILHQPEGPQNLPEPRQADPAGIGELNLELDEEMLQANPELLDQQEGP